MKDPEFTEAKKTVIDNLHTIQQSLVVCVDEGMVDQGAAYYNELLDLIDDAHLISTWEELHEIITLAQTLEVDVAAWHAFHGRTSLSLSWPRARSV